MRLAVQRTWLRLNIHLYVTGWQTIFNYETAETNFPLHPELLFTYHFNILVDVNEHGQTIVSEKINSKSFDSPRTIRMYWFIYLQRKNYFIVYGVNG